MESAVPPSALRDEACVRDVLAGKRERFGELVEQYQGVVFSVILGHVRDAHRAEDLAQEVFLSAYAALRQLSSGRRFLPWVLEIARNRALREGRRRAARPEWTGGVLPEQAQQAESDVSARVSTVLAMVEELPEPARETLLLKYRQGLSCREIAEREGVPLGTITSRLSRALDTLRTALGVKKR